ncbi:A/G-specific adenine glycosylase [Candidatus Blochmanniella vafra str. BVAF]|uniref:Adenine DNA glycosylase n=1 Tax=Blochmanniella vafra (strain BVAF) TaxID=859654 RepID=E8Q632_BLOVB|nr:A/G-specific adenine glycosylase [Candidatus Blochmannia vafer]ADV33648.1 A/G-specific adenine glycosylase [Candidatus Blochmannia vafer str. BVAF]
MTYIAQNNSVFSKRILLWHYNTKISYLPWQLNKTIYKIWISEIMLQQTQVITVIPYFEKFINTFPTISKLAKADSNSILYIWSGLGYYKRAINVHKTAQIIMSQYNGEFPQNFSTILSLPGIGKSTAGAILSLALNKRYPILDGNIKRILMRYYALEYHKNISQSKKDANLWHLISMLMPFNEDVSHFNQAMMNLGRLICTYKNPKCSICPLNDNCQSFLKNKIHSYQQDKKQITKKHKKNIWWIVLLLKNTYIVRLIKRSKSNIWNKLFCFPEFYNIDELNEWLYKYNLHNTACNSMDILQHHISNIKLQIQPILIDINKIITFNKEEGIWYNIYKPVTVGLPKPVTIILKKLIKDKTNLQ